MLAQTISIVEPNKKLITPYNYLTSLYSISRVSTIDQALLKLTKINPGIIFLSASFSASKSVRFLESLNNFSEGSLIPVVIVVDLSNRINFVPGTTWGGKIAVIDSCASKRELTSTLDRILKV